MFYLGGQVKMKPDEEITLDKIKEVREINRKRDIEYYRRNMKTRDRLL
jgi:hypothetical protein